MLRPSEEMSAGDEIGVFDGDICVGSAIYNGNPENPIIITTSMDDPETEEIDGYKQDNPITVYIWKNDSQNISDYLNIEYLTGDQQFKALGTYVGNVIVQATGTNQHQEGTFNVRIMPNPAKDKVFVCVDDVVFSTGVIYIYHISGQLAQTCELKSKKTEINIGNLMSGVYIVNVETENGCFNLRLIKN